ncbi:VanZ family protein [Modestobacter versicolor]|uniref:VanZ family protein n=1 Tax=Modestobacter versicolor TaxID=429133 RepID=UPI0034DF5457
MHRTAARTLLVGYLVAAAALTLGPLPETLLFAVVDALRSVVELPRLRTAAAVERGANVVLFVPLGALLCVALPRFSPAVVWLGCLAGSAAVEAVQSALPGRTSTLDDVLANGLGAAVGCTSVWWLRRRRQST